MDIEKSFVEIKMLIDNARNNALKSVNIELIKLYWNIGSYIKQKLLESQWGEKTIDQLASYLSSSGPDYKGFNRRNLYRMKQFYDAYADNPIVSPLVTQLSWTNNLMNVL